MTPTVVTPPGLRRTPRGRRVRVLAGGVALVVAALGLGPLTATGSAAGPTPVSQGKPAVASSNESDAFPASAAVDGDRGTRWSSAFADEQWLRVDLGAPVEVGQIVLDWEAAHASSYEIQLSDDAENWNTVHEARESAGGTETLEVSGTGRYVRMRGLERATEYGFSLWEFEVHATGDGGTDPAPVPDDEVLLSHGRPGTASSSQHDGNCWECGPDKAFDSDPASRWATEPEVGWTDPGWIAVDLGAPAEISRVVLQWDPAHARSHAIQLSDDGREWRTVWSTTEGRGLKETIDIPAGDNIGRHVRMYGTERAGPHGYSLWEFSVYGTGGDPIAPPPLPPNPGEPMELVWSDEFEGPAGSVPDPTKWRSDPGGGQNNELQYYTGSDNALLDGEGRLVIEARRQETPGTTCPVDPLSGSTTCQYTSGRINTHGLLDFTYGRVEARIKVSSTRGHWPAFWMLGSSFFEDGRPWPHVGEIDIMEHIGSEPNVVHSTLHAPAYFGGNGYGSSFSLPDGQSFGDDFHVYALDWNREGMVFTVDDRVVHTVDREELEATVGPWVFDGRFFLILNSAVGGDWPGPPDSSTVFPQRMTVDWVRVYQ
ncbi:discoidin domain-containing protein [Streptomyces alkaliphilus]|uniref:discoidin domain-containing protein n=1 Tax=Streptomyces alkaliphilus TaxID=1472722 RepID=UPI001180E79F|nr:discoidin domain-containing protein [Streptomyces alkaliphilus]MQS06834.1 family 16 glycosylhydrolase [Streptomyces alkaliphilus]